VAIQIQFQQGSHPSDTLRVVAPTTLRVDLRPEGASRALKIENESGECTRISFRVPAPPGMLDGVAPGEL
jgi:hypothetical protein